MIDAAFQIGGKCGLDVTNNLLRAPRGARHDMNLPDLFPIRGNRSMFDLPQLPQDGLGFRHPVATPGCVNQWSSSSRG